MTTTPSSQHIIQRVKRKLFTKDDDNEKDKVTSDCLLFITFHNDSKDYRNILNRARCMIPHVTVSQCLPEVAADICNKQHFDIIISDIDFLNYNQLIKIIFSIRRSSLKNQISPIVVFKQSHNPGNNILSCYGVTKLYRGDLTISQIDAVLLSFLEHDNRPRPSCQIYKKIINQEMPSNYNDIDAIQMNKKTSQFEKLKSSKNEGQDNCLQVDHIHQDGVSTYLSTLHHRSNTQQHAPVGMKSSILHVYDHEKDGKHHVVGPYGAHVVGRNKMMTTEVDTNSHNSKERLRRERIKDACDQLRELLPKSSIHHKKLDMAMLLESTVVYIKLLHSRSSVLAQEQCDQIYQNYFQQRMNKRRHTYVSGEGYENSPVNTPSLIKEDNNQLYCQNSTNSNEDFFPVTFQEQLTPSLKTMDTNHNHMESNCFHQHYQHQLSQQIQNAATSSFVNKYAEINKYQHEKLHHASIINNNKSA